VRGDAIAGLLILFINLLGGIAIGTLQHKLPLAEAATFYTLLTIGDGLVAQIPSLLLSTAAAIIVTRASGSQDIGQQITKQLFGSPQTLAITAAIIGMLGLIPGMPNLVFLTLASGAGYLAWRSRHRRQATASPAAAGGPAPGGGEAPDTREVGWDDVPALDTVGMEVGYRLIALVDRNQNGQLLTRIKGVRKKLSQELGFLIPRNWDS